jgi:hypothetical protein
MKFSFLFCLFFCAVHCGYGQTFSLRGSVSDTLNLSPLYRASVVLMRTGDSGIVTHTRTGPDGHFELKVAKEGKYLLRITSVSFADYIDVVNVNKPVVNMGEIPMVTREHLLSEFVITQQVAAIKIKGDTTEYMADSFKVKEGANVEDLLRRLPGIQVDKNGKITAQGETVQKVLVDGEEFFSDDPKVVTQGLQATIVNKVQVYDKKSDQAEFTGIDDGQKTRTINLEIKEDKKKGFFGKLDAGGAPDGYYQGQAMINAFKGKRQVSAFGIASNTDKVGLDWQDNDKYSGGNGVITESNENGFTMIGGNYDDFGGWSGRYEGQGLPKVRTAGIHFADRWNEDKDHISGSYRYAMQNVNIDGTNTTQYALAGDTSRVSTEHKTQVSSVERHGFNGVFELKIDTNTSLRVIANGSLKNSIVSSNFHTDTWNMSPEEGPRTTNDRLLTGNTKTSSVNTDLLFKKKFAKKGRTLSVDVKQNYNDTRGSGNLNSTTITPQSGGTTETQFTNQEKTDSSFSLSFSTKATYTEPLSKTAFLEVNYGLSLNNSSARKSTFDKSPGSTVYDKLNDTFSSNYKYNILTHRGGVNFKFAYKKLSFAFGSDLANSGYLQTDMLHGDTSHTYNYTNVYPSATLTYKFAKQTNLRFSYQGQSQQPTLAQIQPLRQNTDPLNITAGNPDLKQEFSNELSLRFSDYKVLSHRYLYLGVSFTSDVNAISTSQVITGPVSTIKYVNVNGNYNSNIWFGYDFKINKPDLNIGLQTNADQSHAHNFINNQDNVSDNRSVSFGPTFSTYKEDKYNFSLEPHVTYNENKSTISAYATNYWSMNTDFTAEVNFTKKIDAGTTVSAMVREKTTIFPTNNQLIKWNAYASMKFLKNNQLAARLTLYDILNQNTGFSRTAKGSTIMQENYSTIRRYIMLSLIWNFTYSPGMAKGSAEETAK